jgi:hypothetical protein
MAKQIIIYNLADNVTDEQYKDFVIKEKGPLLDSLPGVKKFEMVKIMANPGEEVPYRYVGILHIDNLAEFGEKAAPSKKFQDFLQKWTPMAKDPIMLMGEEIY